MFEVVEWNGPEVEADHVSKHTQVDNDDRGYRNEHCRRHQVVVPAEPDDGEECLVEEAHDGAGYGHDAHD